MLLSFYMAAGTHNITIEQGATFQKILYYKDANGNAIDLSNVTDARGQMRQTKASVTSESFTVEVDADPTLGKISWSMSATDTADLDASITYFYDLELEFNDGVVVRLLEGTVTVSGEVTR